jgi:hypothetical protein
MQAVADALSLMANIVMAWNTSDAGGPGSLVEPPPGHSTGTDREDCAHQAGSINLRGVFRFPVTAMLTKSCLRGQMHR